MEIKEPEANFAASEPGMVSWSRKDSAYNNGDVGGVRRNPKLLMSEVHVRAVLSDPSDHLDQVPIYRRMNGLAVLANIPATGRTMDIPTHVQDRGGTPRVPVGVMEETNGHPDGAVEEWLWEELFSPCICDQDDDLIERIMKEMCI